MPEMYSDELQGFLPDESQDMTIKLSVSHSGISDCLLHISKNATLIISVFLNSVIG